MFKILFICFAFFMNFAFANIDVSKFDIIEIKKTSAKASEDEPTKKIQKKYALVMSSTKYNSSSKTIVVVPVVQKTKDYKGSYVVEVKHEGVTYLIFTDKLRTIPKNNAENIIFKLNKNEAKKVESKWNELTKNA